MKKKFFGIVEKCKEVFDDQAGYRLLVASMNGKRFELTIGRVTKKRSNPENRYYRGVVVPIFAEAMGYRDFEHEIVHQLLAARFLIEIILIKGKEFKRVRSTTELTTVEFEAYMSALRQFGSEFFDIFIPEPNELEY